MSEPAAYFITWSCYGQRLPGDARGTVHRRRAEFGTEPLRPSPSYARFAAAKLKHPPTTLSIGARAIVTQAIQDHCVHRNWKLEAINVRTTHAHAVLRAPGRVPEQVLVQFKAWSTRRLREADVFPADHFVWSEHGSTRYLWDECDMAPAVRYVFEMQDDGDRYTPAPWDR